MRISQKIVDIVMFCTLWVTWPNHFLSLVVPLPWSNDRFLPVNKSVLVSRPHIFLRYKDCLWLTNFSQFCLVFPYFYNKLKSVVLNKNKAMSYTRGLMVTSLTWTTILVSLSKFINVKLFYLLLNLKKILICYKIWLYIILF